jgi:hypothetical protein
MTNDQRRNTVSPTPADLKQIDEVAPITDEEFAELVAKEYSSDEPDLEDWYAELPGRFPTDYDCTGEEAAGF